ncbi:MAG TPA: hypothetical protein VJ717_15705 [Gemmatimonadaceae bacterium]|nr:hypothetical protein [Gemmatimonadaceae bacterium]
MMFSHSFSSALLATLFVSAAMIPSALSAQRAADRDNPAARTSTVALLDSVDSSRAAARLVTPVGFTRLLQADSIGFAQQERSRHVGAGSNLALMGTGVAGVLVGMLVGGDGGAAIAVGGGVLGFVGLYRYLR